MLFIQRALRLPLSSPARSAFGILLFLIPVLNILGLIAALGYGSRIINKKPAQLLPWHPADFVRGISFATSAALLALPCILLYLLSASALSITATLSIGIILLIAYTYVIGSTYISYSQHYRLLDAFSAKTWTRLTHADYFIAWLAVIVLNAVALTILVVTQRAIEFTAGTSPAWIALVFALTLILNAVIAWSQLCITAGIYSGVTP